MWWRQPDHFEWLSGYLATRRLQKLIRSMVAVSTVTLSSVTLAMTWSPGGPHRVFGDGAALLAVGWCMAMAVLWACRWPTRWQSVGYAITVLACTTIVCISYADPLFGLIGCIAFAVLGGYIAFFHSARLLVLNLAVAAITALVLTIELAKTSGDLIRAVCGFLVVAVALGSVPFASQALVFNLGVDVMHSDIDPLCGVLNRRAFYRFTRELVASSDGQHYLTVTMVDLDNFKKLNDTQGHAVGDLALTTIAHALRHNSDDNAVVARSGGEEFLLAELVPDARIALRAERLRSAIAATPFGVTASLGVASTRLRPAAAFGRDAIDKLIATADAAMYDAKRSGGNQIRHRVAA
jgi:diguanylate cyclase (GGDEF)-like protein